MDVPTLRSESLQGIDSILQAPWIVQKFITPEAKRLLQAFRNTIEQQPDPWLSPVLVNYQREPV